MSAERAIELIANELRSAASDGRTVERPEVAAAGLLESGVVVLASEREAVAAERDALARIVGDLWDYPPEESPTPQAYEIHLRERWGDREGDVWARLTDPPATRPWDEPDGWALREATA